MGASDEGEFAVGAGSGKDRGGSAKKGRVSWQEGGRNWGGEKAGGYGSGSNGTLWILSPPFTTFPLLFSFRICTTNIGGEWEAY